MRVAVDAAPRLAGFGSMLLAPGKGLDSHRQRRTASLFCYQTTTEPLCMALIWLDVSHRAGKPLRRAGGKAGGVLQPPASTAPHAGLPIDL